MKNLTKLFISIIFFIVCFCNQVFSQADVSGVPGHTWVSTYYLGWNAADNLDFKVGTQYMQLTGAGLFGISPNFSSGFTPGAQLDVDGNMNIGIAYLLSDNSAYQINYQNFLWHNGETTNVLCGVGTGTGGVNNTFIESHHPTGRPCTCWV